MIEFFTRLLQSRYVGLLEGEVVRLRAENRALTNSLLGTAGFPPVDFPEAPKPQDLPRARRRSWHQIQAWRRRKRRVRSQPRQSARIEIRFQPLGTIYRAPRFACDQNLPVPGIEKFYEQFI